MGSASSYSSDEEEDRDDEDREVDLEIFAKDKKAEEVEVKEAPEAGGAPRRLRRPRAPESTAEPRVVEDDEGEEAGRVAGTDVFLNGGLPGGTCAPLLVTEEPPLLSTFS